MERGAGEAPAISPKIFKSHHSGMESGAFGIKTEARESLNRTIVGWKARTGGDWSFTFRL